MKKLLKIFVIFLIAILVLVIAGAIISFKTYSNIASKLYNKVENITQENEKNIVVIANGKIENEDLIDKFIDECYNSEKKISLEIDYNGENIKIDSLLNFDIFKMTVNDNNEELFDKLRWKIKRKVENNEVILYFYSIAEVTEFPEICRYNLDDSRYISLKTPIYFYQRKDMKANKIIDKTSSEDYDFDIYTVGGDVNVVTEEESMMDFKDALEQRIISAEDILNQAKIDTKYGICEEEMYSDGGTIVYRYENYTLIKYNTLDGNIDFVIGPKGDIRNQVDKILYK